MYLPSVASQLLSFKDMYSFASNPFDFSPYLTAPQKHSVFVIIISHHLSSKNIEGSIFCIRYEPFRFYTRYGASNFSEWYCAILYWKIQISWRLRIAIFLCISCISLHRNSLTTMLKRLHYTTLCYNFLSSQTSVVDSVHYKNGSFKFYKSCKADETSDSLSC